MSNPCLEWLDINNETHRLDIIDRVFIGRLCKGIDETKRIIVYNSMVSRDHAEIIWSGSRLKIKDLSKNGTWINGVRIAGGSEECLNDGDVIRIGETLFAVRYPGSQLFGEDHSVSGLSTDLTPKEVIVTNVVADIRGFTSMSETEKSYEVYTLMKEVFKQFGKIVNSHNGTVKDHVGDAIYAYWEHGISLSKEQAIMACRNALAQAEALDHIRDELLTINPAAEKLKMGWGVTTGTVTMSNYGMRSSDLALVGDCTNLAFRLSGMANKELKKKILICKTTATLIRDSLDVYDLGEAYVRGREGTLQVFGM
ncbi:MAG: adenylate/guanylate cyclase domain-containing protein [Deltaproteobacteria bacterium]|nr:adenylate/guanylate cyclase domain-containing protein [Deltaproteobacteria bacterium]